MKSFRELCDAGLQEDGYEPQQVCLIPLYLRTRHQFYLEAERAIRERVERVWQTARHAWPSREAFDKAESTESIWLRESPPWWGVNDIVGFVDLRMSLLEQEFQASLFSPIKRVSRRLRDKTFVFRLMVRRNFPFGRSNAVAQELLLEMLAECCLQPEARKRHVDLESWTRIIQRMDLIGLLSDHAVAYGVEFR